MANMTCSINMYVYFWVAFLIWKLFLGKGPFDLLHSMFNCRGIFDMLHMHLDPVFCPGPRRLDVWSTTPGSKRSISFCFWFCKNPVNNMIQSKSAWARNRLHNLRWALTPVVLTWQGQQYLEKHGGRNPFLSGFQLLEKNAFYGFCTWLKLYLLIE